MQHQSTLDKKLYYIHTEKYSPKSYVVNFRTQISYSQSEERTMVFTREKYDIENTSWKVLAYGIYARVVDVSEIERVSAANE